MELPKGAPAPRLCHLIKWDDFDGYGFNLHSEKSKSNCQYVGKVDHSSPAQAAGLREADRIIEVNGVNISTENHRQVVERIKANPQETKLLVIDHEGELWYKSRDLVIRGIQSNVIHIKTPVPRPTTSNGHHNEESPTNDSSESPNSSPNFHDLSISDANDSKTEFSPIPTNIESPSATVLVHQTNGHEENKIEHNQEECVKVNGTHEVLAVEPNDLIPEPEEVSKSPNKLVPPSTQAPATVMNGTTQSSESGEEDTKMNKSTTDSINNNNIEENKSRKLPLRQESGLSNEAASSSSRSSTCGSPDHLEQLKIVSPVSASKMQQQPPSNGSLSQADVNLRPMSKNDANGVHVKHSNGGGSRGSSESTGSIPASPTSMKSSGSNSISNEPTSMANLSTSSSTMAMLSTNGRPPSESDVLQLNLNMSVSEMRQMLARKKKQDPKKAQMDLKQKYEIIQQM